MKPLPRTLVTNNTFVCQSCEMVHELPPLYKAAPKMYKAIKEYLEWGPKTNSDRYLLDSQFEKAIAKVRGK